MRVAIPPFMPVCLTRLTRASTMRPLAPHWRVSLLLSSAMSRVCPHCHSALPETDRPADPCPKCGKVGAAAPSATEEATTTYLPPVKTPFRSRSVLSRLLIAGLFICWLLIYYWPV